MNRRRVLRHTTVCTQGLGQSLNGQRRDCWLRGRWTRTASRADAEGYGQVQGVDRAGQPQGSSSPPHTHLKKSPAGAGRVRLIYRMSDCGDVLRGDKRL